jgi:hypothetical protein
MISLLSSWTSHMTISKVLALIIDELRYGALTQALRTN